MTVRFRIRYRSEASDDFAREYQYSRRLWGAKHARAYFTALRAELSRLTEQPYRCPRIPGHGAEWRRLVLPGHQILYRVDDRAAAIEIFAILGRHRSGELAEIPRTPA